MRAALKTTLASWAPSILLLLLLLSLLFIKQNLLPRVDERQNFVWQLQSNHVNTDTEGAIKSVCIYVVSVLSGSVEFKENARALFPQGVGQRRLSLKMRCPY